MILTFTATAMALAAVAAVGYAVATVGMKVASDGLMPLGVTLAAAGFAAAFLAEVVLLRRADLSVVYIVVVATETLLVLTVAAMIGEGLNLRQTAGAVLVMTGLVAVTA